MSVFEEFLPTACEAVRRSGAEALDALGWWDMLADLEDPTARAAVFALFRAQGRELASTGALGGLLAAPYLAAVDGSVRAAITTAHADGVASLLVIGEPGERTLIDLPAQGAAIVTTKTLGLAAAPSTSGLAIHRATVAVGDLDLVIDAPAAAASSARALALGRVACAHEILGAAEAMLELAVAYASDREQFGKPIGTFQALRHILAWAAADLAAATTFADLTVERGAAMPASSDVMLKALAGRNAKRVCQRTLQCLGGIGFTAEHDHHRFHSRVLVLDAVLGSSSALTCELGMAWRAGAADPAIPKALLAG